MEHKRLLAEKSAVALRLVGRWAVPMWWRIVRGDPPPEFAGCSARRVAVLERASLVCLDVARDQLPDDPDAWTEEPLTKRITALREEFARERRVAAEWTEREAQIILDRSRRVGSLAGRLPRIIVTTPLERPIGARIRAKQGVLP